MGIKMVLALLILGTILLVRADDQQYTTKYDNLDVDAVIKNDRLLINYVGCLLDHNPCTPDAAELKKNLPDALGNNCASCSEKQKEIADRVSHHLIDHRPDDWMLLEQKYEPSGSYRKNYLEGKTEETASSN